MDLEHLAREAQEILERRYADKLEEGERVRVRFSHFRGARRVEVALVCDERDRVFEFFADLPDLDDDEAIYLGLDFLDGVLDEVLGGGREAFPPLDPRPYEFEGHTVYLSGGLRRPELEAWADRLLERGVRGDGETL